MSDVIDDVRSAMRSIQSTSDLVEFMNQIRVVIHDEGPFKSEPVDLVQWVEVDKVTANDYNPNTVAPPEMELLRHSIHHDGYTQPVVTWESTAGREVIDGFHRTRVCKEMDDVRERVQGFLPVVTVKNDCTDRNDRIASTIRHNRARGKHKVDSMSEIVIELKKRNWTDKRIAKELGMDEDEILRLCQVSGLSELFDDDGFSASWDIGVFDDRVELDFDSPESSDDSRIYHTWDKWECFESGFYGSAPPKGMTKEDCEIAYKTLLSDIPKFRGALDRVTNHWIHSCEHYLTNEKMNRIAWLGQACLAIEFGIPAIFRSGYNLLTDDEAAAADAEALVYLNKWLESNGRNPLTMDDCASKTKANIY